MAALRSQLKIGSREWLNMLDVVELHGPWPHVDQHTLARLLWAGDRTCVVFVVRRLGCPLCRELVAGLLKYQEEFDDAEADVVIVSAQEVGAEDVATGRFVRFADDQPARSSAFQERLAARMKLSNVSVYVDHASAFYQLLGGRRADNQQLLQPSVLARVAVNAVRYGGRVDDINERSDYLGGTLVIHPSLGVVHCQQETEDFRNMCADDLLQTVEELLEKAETAYVQAIELDAGGL